MNLPRCFIVRMSPICLAAWVVLVTASSASADDTAIIVSGSAPQRQRELAENAVSKAADADPGSAVVAAAFSARDLLALSKCLAETQPWACMTPALHGKHVQRLAFVSIDSQSSTDGSTKLVITEQLVAPGLFAPLGDKRYCDHCTDDVLAKLAGELTRDVLRELATRGGRTVLSIKSVPRGARITLDGKLVGATDSLRNTYPGTHSLSLELDGYQIVTRDAEAVEGKTVEVNATLVSTASAIKQPTRREVAPPERGWFGRSPGWVPWLCIGVGGAAIVTGGVLYLYNGEPSRDPSADQSRHYTSFQGPGIATAVVGAVSLGFGLYLHHRQHEATSVIAATPSRDGLAIHWTGSF